MKTKRIRRSKDERLSEPITFRVETDVLEWLNAKAQDQDLAFADFLRKALKQAMLTDMDVAA